MLPTRNVFILFASTKRTKKHARRAAPTGETDYYFLRRAKSNTKSTRGKPCDLGSKLYRLYFFVIFPPFVPKPVYSATRFFGCFEPVRKGCCTSDARPLFFENGMPYCKLTGACRIRKGQLLVIFVAVRICFGGVLIKYLEVSQVF